MQLSICLVGCGYIAESVHGPAYRRLAETYPGLRLAACCDTEESKAASFASNFGFGRHYTDLTTMLEAERPDVVCLLVPGHLTSRLAVDILGQGYPLLVEKPPGLNREETEAIVRAAERSGAANRVAFNRRYMPVMTELKRLVEEAHRPEDIRSIRYDMYRHNRRDEDFAETAIHGIDAVRFIAGSDYERVTFAYQELPELGPGVANVFLHARMTSGASAQLSFCPAEGLIMERASVALLNETYFAELPVWHSVDWPGRIRRFAGGREETEIRGDSLGPADDMSVSNGFYQEHESFLLALANGRKPEGEVASALQSVEIADCIRKRSGEYRKQV
ncbi:Gfo/Idh/MocA family protein [Cohnella sp. GCM10020058]|uniref:Gfo/Idh/MocA family protein n=1 Tax=Cohnella sp. GCM10020058 TaxID=3317330 RepID=UPI00363D7FB6